MMLASFALLASPLTFEAPAAPLGRVFERLEASTGIVWRADPEMAQRVVFVSVRDVTPEDLRSRLAEAVGGRWRDRGGVPFLEQEPVAARVRQEAILAARQAEIERMFAQYRKMLEQPFDRAEARDVREQLDRLDQNDPAFWQRQTALSLRGPATRALIRLLLGIPVRDLAALTPYSRTVYTLDPTRMQRPLGRDAGRVVDEYIQEQGVWAAEFVAQPFGGAGSMMVSDPRTRTSPIATRPNLYLVVSRGQEASLFNVNLVMGEGRHGPTILAQLSVREDFLMPRRAPVKLPSIPVSPIEWSEAASQFLAAVSERGPEAAPLGPAARAVVLDPVTHEPADVMLGDALRSWARTGYDVVAALPDAAVAGSLFRAQRESPLGTVRGFLEPLFAHELMEVLVDSGWAVLSPNPNDRVRLSSVNRRVIRDLTRSTDRDGVTIDALATYSWNTRHEDPLLGFVLASLLDPQVFRHMGGGGSPDALLLYGSLSRRQRIALESGEALTVAALTAAQREVVRRIAYRSEVRRGAPVPMGWAGTMVEPTTAFPNGLPGTGFVSLVIQREETLTEHRRLPDGTWQMIGPTTAHVIGWQLARQAAGAARELGRALPDGFTISGQERLEFRVNFDAEHWQPVEMTRMLPTSGTPVPWTELPERIRQEIERNRAHNEAQQAGGGRTGTGPP